MNQSLRSRHFLAALSCMLFSLLLRAQIFDPTGSAQGFNVMVQNNIRAQAGATYGPVAMGGDLVLDGSTIFTMNTTGKYPSGVLNDQNNFGIVIGGRIYYNSGNATQINQGYLRIGNTTGSTLWYVDDNNIATNLKLTAAGAAFTSSPSVTLQRTQTAGTATNAHGLDFATAFLDLTSNSSLINAYTSTTNSLLNKITIPGIPNPHLTLQNDKINYINLTELQADNLKILGSITFDNHPTASSPLVFNIQASTSYNWEMPNLGGVSEGDGDYILWNFYGPQNLELAGSNTIYGTIMAPQADIVKSNPSNINGQVIGRSLVIGPGEILYHPFSSVVTNINVNIDVNINLTPLPVSDLEVQAVQAEQSVLLSWKVLHEQNMNRYVVEKSGDGALFTSIGSVRSTGDHPSFTYGFVDSEAVSNGKVTYYRITALEMTGKKFYSKIIPLHLTAKSISNVNGWPNPVTSSYSLSYRSLHNQKVSVAVYSGNGIKIKELNFQAYRGGNLYTLDDFRSLPSGIYLLRLKGGEDGNEHTIRVVKN